MGVLPEGLFVRPPTLDDAEAIVKLLIICENTIEYIDYSVKALLASWQTSEFNIETDAWVIVTNAEEIVGYAFVQGHHAPISIICEDPAYNGQGLWFCLLQKVEARVYPFLLTNQPSTEITLSIALNDAHKIARQTVEQEGYKLVHTAWRMEIKLDHMPEKLSLPYGITIRPFIRGQDEHPVHEMTQNAFQLNEPFEEWEAKFADDTFDSSLWFIAVADGNIVGGALCYNEIDGGWVWSIAVQNAWRHKGIGMALLQHAFAEFYKRGKREVGLGVNAENSTGATRLYHRAGMHVAQKYYTYHKKC